jgi:hypothetical protein
MKTPKGFNLQKCSLLPNGRLTVGYSTNESNFKGETPKQATHEDLRVHLQALKYALIASHGLDWPDRIFLQKQIKLDGSEEEKDAVKLLQPFAKDWQKGIQNAVRVTGFEVSGEGNTHGVIVKGMLTIKEQAQEIKTRKILFDNNSPNAFGFEEYLLSDVKIATQEVEQYLFQDKFGDPIEKETSQTALFTDDLNGKKPKAVAEKTVVLKPKSAPKKAASKK